MSACMSNLLTIIPMTMDNRKKILITGASGFIGGFIVGRALDEGMEVWAAVRGSSSRECLSDPCINFICLDLSDPAGLEAALSEHTARHGRWDIVVHNAGVTKCRRRDDFMRINRDATRHLAGTLVRLGAVPDQFVYMSTLSVFGPIHERDGLAYTEDDPRCPDTAYGRSKAEAEDYLASLEGFPYVIIRPTGVYGPHEHDYYLMARSVAAHLDFSAGLRPQLLTFIYVRDLVEAIFLAVARGVKRRAYNVADGQTYDTTTFSRLLQAELGNPRVVRFACPLPLLRVISWVSEHVAAMRGRAATLNTDKYRIMRQRNWQCDITRLRTELGFEPRYLLPRGVKETVAWYKANGWL